MTSGVCSSPVSFFWEFMFLKVDIDTEAYFIHKGSIKGQRSYIDIKVNNFLLTNHDRQYLLPDDS